MQSENLKINITVGELIERLNFLIKRKHITKNSFMLLTDKTEILVLQNLILPSIKLKEDKKYKMVQMMFTSIEPDVECESLFEIKSFPIPVGNKLK